MRHVFPLFLSHTWNIQNTYFLELFEKWENLYLLLQCHSDRQVCINYVKALYSIYLSHSFIPGKVSFFLSESSLWMWKAPPLPSNPAGAVWKEAFLFLSLKQGHGWDKVCTQMFVLERSLEQRGPFSSVAGQAQNSNSLRAKLGLLAEVFVIPLWEEGNWLRSEAEELHLCHQVPPRASGWHWWCWSLIAWNMLAKFAAALEQPLP